MKLFRIALKSALHRKVCLSLAMFSIAISILLLLGVDTIRKQAKNNFIHVPPPPINQTVLVKTAPNNGIKTEDSFGAIWVSGQMQIESKKTDIGEAGYRIKNAIIETYTE